MTKMTMTKSVKYLLIKGRVNIQNEIISDDLIDEDYAALQHLKRA